MGIIKGIAALIKSGILIRPYTISGIILAITFVNISKDNSHLYELLKTDLPYTAISGLALLLAVVSKKSRTYGKFDPEAFLKCLFGYGIAILITFFCTIAFYMSLISF